MVFYFEIITKIKKFAHLKYIMIRISHHRVKCIGCNYCCELAPERWSMSKKDGKSVLIGAKDKRGFFTIKVGDHESESNLKAAEVCPVKIIKVRII